MPLILSIRSRLLSGEPLATQGIARLKTLLRDRSGACYIPSGHDALRLALQEISELLGRTNDANGPSPDGVGA